jgi:hypothetical protein
MRASAAAAWPALCTQYEGRCYWLYLDTLFYPTTGLGYRVVDLESMRSLPWLTSADTPATQNQIDAEWRKINNRRDLAAKGGFAYKSAASLHLDDVAVDGLLAITTSTFWSTLTKTLPDLDAWPADAQLALMDMAWNLGPNFLGPKWPNFTKAAKAANFDAAAASCLRSVKAPRDYRHQRMFTNAAAVVHHDLDPAVLWDTHDPTSGPATPPEPTHPPTQPPPAPPETPVKHSDQYHSDYVFWRGGNIPPLVVEILEAIPSTVRLSQGGLSNSVAASARTHNGLGAYDISVKGWSKKKILTLCAELIRSGECAFPRGGWFGSAVFSTHVHVCSNNCYPSLHPEAQAQVRDFEHTPRRNGLVGHGRYSGPNVALGTWKDSPYNPDNIREGKGVFYVASDALLGLSVDRKTKESKKKGDRISYVLQVRRWGRWNAVTGRGRYFAISDDKQIYLSADKPVA